MRPQAIRVNICSALPGCQAARRTYSNDALGGIFIGAPWLTTPNVSLGECVRVPTSARGPRVPKRITSSTNSALVCLPTKITQPAACQLLIRTSARARLIVSSERELEASRPAARPRRSISLGARQPLERLACAGRGGDMPAE